MLDFPRLNKCQIHRGGRQGGEQARRLASDTKPQQSFQGLEAPSGTCSVDAVRCEIKANDKERYPRKGP